MLGEDFTPPAASPPSSSSNLHPDPDEVDLSTHSSAARIPNTYSNPNRNNAGPTEADIRALLRNGAPQPGNDSGQQQGDEDPMMKMLQQLMGGMPPTGDDGQPGGLPPGLAAMLGGGGMPGMPGMGGPPPQQNSTYAYLWRIIHALSALILGVYITLTSHAFTGDISRGGITGAGHEGGINVFWVFATAELVLQSSRFFLEKGAGSQLGGWMGMVAGFLPEPWKGYVTLAARYSGIWSTIVEDGMVVVFIVGAVAWWKGAVG